MNSLVLSIVSIDGSGNGSGLIKIPMMNNVKLGVTLSGIQVAEGGCVVAGRAELNGISASVLTEQQRVNLEKAYTVFNQAIDAGIANAGAIAETYNDIADLYEGMAKKTQAMLDKLNNGEKISQRDAKALEEMKKQATLATDKMIDALKTKFGSEGSEEFITFIKSTTESCVCSADIEKPKKGPNAEFYFSFDDDCKKCLEEQKKKQEQAAQIIKKVQKFLIVKMECGCFSWENIMNDFGHKDKNCEEVINKVEMVKNAIKTGKSLPTNDLTIQGQVLIGNVCYTDLQVISIQGNLDPKKFEINSDGITFKNVLKFNISESDNRKMKVELLRKYLFEEVKEVEKDTIKGKYVPPEGAVDVNLLEFSSNGIEFLKRQEGVITHVYNDAKGGSSKYCVEHKNHYNSDWFCTENNHYGIDSKGNPILGKPTIGLGHLIKSQEELKQYCSVDDKVQLSKEDCWTLFKEKDLPKYETPLKSAIDVPITQYQYDALLSFVFNTGTDRLRDREVFKKYINKGVFDKDKIKAALDKWHIPPIVIPRRNDEVNLFNNGKYTFQGNEIN